jgi:hypothetical protein
MFKLKRIVDRTLADYIDSKIERVIGDMYGHEHGLELADE